MSQINSNIFIRSVTTLDTLKTLLSDSIPTRMRYAIGSFIAVTIHAPDTPFHKPYRSAVSCARATGLPTYIVSPSATRLLKPIRSSYLKSEYLKPQHINLALFELFPEAETILYFSPNLRFTEELDCRRFDKTSELIFARSEPSRHELADLILYGIPFSQFITSSMFIISRRYHVELFSEARALLEEEKWRSANSSILLSRASLKIPLPRRCLGTLPQYPIAPLTEAIPKGFPIIKLVKVFNRWTLSIVEGKLADLPNVKPVRFSGLDRAHRARRVVCAD
jgi:hypothetical protein